LEQEEEGYRKCGGKGGYKNVSLPPFSPIVFETGLGAMRWHAIDLRRRRKLIDQSSSCIDCQTMSNILIALKKRPPPPSSTLSLSDPLLGTQSTYLVAQAALARSSAVASLLSAAAIAPFILSPKDLVKWEYVTEVPSTLGGSRPHSEGETQTCSRCDKAFVVPPGGVASLESEGDEEAREKSKCWYHHGRRRWSKERDGTRSQVATCCGGAWTGQGCTTGRSHVWKEEDVGVLNERVGFVRTEELESNRGAGRGKGRQKMVLVGCDCEMIVSAFTSQSSVVISEG
jgi:hypothetical protein